jgi:excisionase family DNA binding protein
MCPKLRQDNARPDSQSQPCDSARKILEPRWLKSIEAARILGVSRPAFYRIYRRGHLPSLRVPGLGIRVDKKQLIKLLKKAKDERSR